MAGAQQADRDQRRGRERLEHDAAPELLHHDHRLDRTEAQPAVRLRHLQPGQAELRDLAPGIAE